MLSTPLCSMTDARSPLFSVSEVISRLGNLSYSNCYCTEAKQWRDHTIRHSLMNFIWRSWQCDTGHGKEARGMKCRRENRRHDATSCYVLKSGAKHRFWVPAQYCHKRAPVDRVLCRTTFTVQVVSIMIITRQTSIRRTVHSSSNRDSCIEWQLVWQKTPSVTILRSQWNYYYYLLTYSFIYLLTYLLTYLLSYLLTHSLTYFLTYLLTHSLTYLLSYSLTQSLTHTLT
jgi:hypothetical protein